MSAWASESRLCIGQKKVKDKSNEITAVPELLQELDIKACTVTMDAMGCQKEIAQQIVGQEGDYILSVKGNQGDLLEEISDAFQYYPTTHTSDEQWEYERGRYENRRCLILDAAGALSSKRTSLWPSIKTLVKIESLRMIKSVKCTETRYYISSHAQKTTKQYNEMIRGYWGIENHLHWHLDVTFAEDACRARTGNAPKNLNLLRKIALHRITRGHSKISKKKRRFRASMNTDYLEEILKI